MKLWLTSVFKHIHSTLIIRPEPVTSMSKKIKRLCGSSINLELEKEFSAEQWLLVSEGPRLERVYVF